MRLAHHFLRHPSGVWHFRLTVPADLREAFGLRIIKRSLGTRDPVKARAWAYALGARYAQLIAKARTGAGMGSEFEEYLKQLSRFELTQGPDGLSVKTNGTYEDNVAALEAMGYAVGVKGPGFPSGPHLVQLIAEGHAKLAKRPHSNAPTLAEASKAAMQNVNAPDETASTANMVLLQVPWRRVNHGTWHTLRQPRAGLRLDGRAGREGDPTTGKAQRLLTPYARRAAGWRESVRRRGGCRTDSVRPARRGCLHQRRTGPGLSSVIGSFAMA